MKELQKCAKGTTKAQILTRRAQYAGTPEEEDRYTHIECSRSQPEPDNLRIRLLLAKDVALLVPIPSLVTRREVVEPCWKMGRKKLLLNCKHAMFPVGRRVPSAYALFLGPGATTVEALQMNVFVMIGSSALSKRILTRRPCAGGPRR